MMCWQQQLADLGEFQAGVSLAEKTTLGVGGAARWMFLPADVAALQQALRCLPQTLAVLPLGRGSNLLIADEGFDGLVIDTGALRELRHDDRTLIAGAGVRMPKLAQYAAQAGLSGIEFMATVPGDVGGGVAMNAGAFGQQWSDTLSWVEVVERDGQCRRYPAAALSMRYRRTLLPTGSIVVRAAVNLQQDDREAIRQRMRQMRQQRSNSQPLEQPNCGSVFKNPVGDHAARLIEAAGLKGYGIGGAQISDVHANFIVNRGDATAHDVLALIRLVQATVKEKFAIELEPEVRIPAVPS